MPAQSLNHFTITDARPGGDEGILHRHRRAEVGDRPPLAFDGYWLYCGGVPTVHLIYNRKGDKPMEGAPPTGRLDHIAFASTGLKDMRAKLEQHKVKYEETGAAADEHDAVVLSRSRRHRDRDEFSTRGDGGTRMTAIRARLAHMGIFVRDRGKMVKFYTDVLGLMVTDEGETSARRTRACI